MDIEIKIVLTVSGEEEAEEIESQLTRLIFEHGMTVTKDGEPVDYGFVFQEIDG